ncbi:MAG: hypothetical protein ACI31V_05665 [Bacilli bacterium]
MTHKKQPRFVSLLADTTIKYLWKNPSTKNWFNEIILEKANIDLSDYILVDGELNTGSKVKDFRTDLTFSNKKNSLIVEMNREYSLSGETKGKLYLFRRAGNSFNSGEKYKDDRSTVLIMFNNYKKKDFIECKTATYTFTSKELEHTYNDIKLIEIYLPNFHEMCYHECDKIDKRLWLFTSKSYKEMYNVVTDEPSLILIKELERLGMNDKFIDEYDTELVNRTMMESMKDEGYNEGKTAGKTEEKIEIAKKMIQDNLDVLLISKYSGLTIQEIENLK